MTAHTTKVNSATVTIKKLDNHEVEAFASLVRLFDEVFEMQDFVMPRQSHLEKILNKDDFMVFVATVQEKVIGGLTLYKLEQYYSPKPLVYLYDMAVAIAFQRKGIGKKLLETAHTYCKDQGFEELFVQAEEIDKHAVEFYRSCKPSGEMPVRYFYWQN